MWVCMHITNAPGIQFISNICFGRIIHGTRIRRRMVVSTVIILGGIVLVVMFSPSVNPDFDVKQLKALYTRRAFHIYAATLVVLAGGLTTMYTRYRAHFLQAKPLPRDLLVRSTSYAMASAVLGTQSTLQAKILSELLVTDNAVASLRNWFTYVTLVAFVGSTCFWLYRMNHALALFDPLFIIPVLQIFWTLFATLNGGIFFREFFGDGFSLCCDVPGFASGIFVIFVGVFLLAPRKMKESLSAGMRERSSPPPPACTVGGTNDHGEGEGDGGGDDVPRGAQLVARFLLEAENMLMTLGGVEEEEDEEVVHLPGAVDDNRMETLVGPDGAAPRMLSLLGEMPVVIANDRTNRAFRGFYPTFGRYDPRDVGAEQEQQHQHDRRGDGGAEEGGGGRGAAVVVARAVAAGE